MTRPTRVQRSRSERPATRRVRRGVAARPATEELARQTLLAQLGELAVDADAEPPLLQAATALACQALRCDAVLVGERAHGGLVLRAATGLPPEAPERLAAPPAGGHHLSALGFRVGAEVPFPGHARPQLVAGAYRQAGQPLDARAVLVLEAMVRLLAAAVARQRAERELVERVEVLAAVFEARPEPELLVDDAGVVREAGTAACRLLELPRWAIVGRALVGALEGGAASLAVADGAPRPVRVTSVMPVAGGARAVRLAAPACRPSGARTRLLVVDDDPMVGAALARTFADEHEVTVVEDAAAALARLDAGERYDAILSDLLMPGMSGLELYRALAAAHPASARRLAFLTGGSFEPGVRAFLEAEAVPWLEKPFELPALRALLAGRLAR